MKTIREWKPHSLKPNWFWETTSCLVRNLNNKLDTNSSEWLIFYVWGLYLLPSIKFPLVKWDLKTSVEFFYKAFDSNKACMQNKTSISVRNLRNSPWQSAIAEAFPELNCAFSVFATVILLSRWSLSNKLFISVKLISCYLLNIFIRTL